MYRYACSTMDMYGAMHSMAICDVYPIPIPKDLLHMLTIEPGNLINILCMKVRIC